MNFFYVKSFFMSEQQSLARLNVSHLTLFGGDWGEEVILLSKQGIEWIYEVFDEAFRHSLPRAAQISLLANATELGVNVSPLKAVFEKISGGTNILDLIIDGFYGDAMLPDEKIWLSKLTYELLAADMVASANQAIKRINQIDRPAINDISVEDVVSAQRVLRVCLIKHATERGVFGPNYTLRAIGPVADSALLNIRD